MKILISILSFALRHWHAVGAVVSAIVVFLADPSSGLAAVAHTLVILFAGIAAGSYGTKALR